MCSKAVENEMFDYDEHWEILNELEDFLKSLDITQKNRAILGSLIAEYSASNRELGKHRQKLYGDASV